MRRKIAIQIESITSFASYYQAKVKWTPEY